MEIAFKSFTGSKTRRLKESVKSKLLFITAGVGLLTLWGVHKLCSMLNGKQGNNQNSKDETCFQKNIREDEVIRAQYINRRNELLATNIQAMKIRATFDKIVMKIPSHRNSSYEPLQQILDYRRYGNPKKDKDRDPNKLYLPYSTTWFYRNRSGNPMEITYIDFSKEGVDYSCFKIQIHSETEPLTLDKADAITEEVYHQYLRQHGKRSIIRPFPVVVEIALDHYCCDSYLFYVSTQHHLFKKYGRKCVEYSDENGKPKVKGILDYRFVLYPEFPTFYIGGRGSSVFARCYLMFPLYVDAAPVFRLEAVYQEDYFKKYGVTKIGQLATLDFVNAWKEHFHFKQLNLEGVKEISDSHGQADLINEIAEMAFYGNYETAIPSYPTQHDAYDLIKLLPRNKTDWTDVYAVLPDNVRESYDHYLTTPNSRWNFPTVMDAYRELGLHRYTGIPYEHIRCRLIDNPEDKLLLDMPVMDDYNRKIISAILSLMRATPVRYRVEQATKQVRETAEEKNISQIARLAHTTRREAQKYCGGASCAN